MKKQNFLLVLVVGLLLGFASCEPVSLEVIVNDFEDVVLESESYYNGSDTVGTKVDGVFYTAIYSGSAILQNVYEQTMWGGYWSGFAMSNVTDSVTPGFANQYGVMAGSGADGSSNFALAYDSANIYLSYVNSYQRPQSIELCNSTWAYRDMESGSGFSKKFGEGDWFKVIVTGYMSNNQTGSVEFYLADFREGKSIMIRDWTTVSLKTLGICERISFTFDSSDTGDWGINTPVYVCVDNLTVALEEM